MIVGLVANPASSKDIRRLVGLGRVVDASEKANVVARILVGLASGPPVEVHALDDNAGLVRWALRMAGPHAPPLRWLPIEPVGTDEDTRGAARHLATMGASALVVVGGDGTARAAVEGWPEAPLVPLAAGTNNALAVPEEPTVLGLATGLATDPRVGRTAFRPVPRLEVATLHGTSAAIIDVVGVRSRWIGSGALWEPAALVEAVVTSARSTAVGLASVAAAFGPLDEGTARYLRFGPGPEVTAVLGPGIVTRVTVSDRRELLPDESLALDPASTVVAVDGERRLLGDGGEVTVRRGPRLLHVPTALEAAGRLA